MIKLAIAGNSHSGKTSVKDFIREFLEEKGITETITLKFADPLYDYLDYIDKPKNRGYLQDMADLTKKYYGDDVFVNTLIASDKVCTEEYEGESSWDSPKFCDAIIVDDVRTKIEYEAVVKLGYITIFVDAPMADRIERSKANGYEILDQHNSEIDVMKLKPFCDYIITNNGNNLLDLKAKCEQVFKCITF